MSNPIFSTLENGNINIEMFPVIGRISETGLRTGKELGFALLDDTWRGRKIKAVVWNDDEGNWIVSYEE